MLELLSESPNDLKKKKKLFKCSERNLTEERVAPLKSKAGYNVFATYHVFHSIGLQ